MKGLWRTALCLALVASAAPSNAQPRHERSRDERAIIRGEHDWGHAYVTGDVGVVRGLLAEDFRGIDRHGVFYDKARVMRDVQEVPHATSDEVGPITVRFYGDTAIAQAHEYSVGPLPVRKANEHVFTDTWVKIDGRWRIVTAADVDVEPVTEVPKPSS